MRKILIPILAVFLAALPGHADQPWNDDLSNAIPVSQFPATITADTDGATTDIHEEECSSFYGAALPARAVWYRLDLPADAEQILISHSSDAHVVLWAEGPLLYGAANGMGRWSCAYPDDDWPHYVGTGYQHYLSVGAPLGGDIDPAEISIDVYSEADAPANDVPYRATRITSLPYTTEVDTRRAGYDSDAQGCSQGAFVWYRYTPAVAHNLRVRVAPVASWGATVAVYALDEDVRTLGCAGNGWDDGDAVVTTPVDAGVDVLIGVGSDGRYSVSVTEAAPPPSPDDRANAAPLGLGEALPFDTAGATLEPGEPASCGDGGSLWFTVPALARESVVSVTGGASVATVSGPDITACSTSGQLALPPGGAATHLQVRAPGAQGVVSLRFESPLGTQVSGETPFPAGCDDPSGVNFRGSEVEVHHAVNPNDPDHIVATWQQDRFWSGGGANGIGAAVTFDGGATWTPSVLPGVSQCSGGTFPRATDPWAAIDADGTVHVMTLSFTPLRIEPVNLANTLLVNRSEDGGLTWKAPTMATVPSPGGVFHDKETMTADPNTPGLLYAVWDAWPTNAAFPVFAKSTDGGATWTPPVPLPTTGSGAGDQIAVLDDGTLVEIAPRASMQSITSRDGGLTWTGPSRIGDRGYDDGPPGVRGGAYIPSVATNGRSVFVSWSDTVRTYVARSDDAGDTWSVSELGPAGWYGHEEARFTTAVAVTGSGAIAVATYMIDRSDRTWLNLGISRDGGTTWSEAPITETWDMQRAASTVRGYFLGDYFAMSGVSDDEVLVTYTAVPPGEERAVSNVYSLRLTL